MILLSGASLTGLLLDALEVDGAYRLAALDPMLDRALSGRGGLAKRYSAAILQRAAAWAERLDPVLDRPDEDNFQAMISVEAIGPGEAQLLAAVAATPHGVFITGDKRACRALASEPSLARLRNHLQAKVLCFEGALRLILDHAGFKPLADGLAAVRECNSTIRILLTEGSSTQEESFVAALSPTTARWRRSWAG